MFSSTRSQFDIQSNDYITKGLLTASRYTISSCTTAFSIQTAILILVLDRYFFSFPQFSHSLIYSSNDYITKGRLKDSCHKFLLHHSFSMQTTILILVLDSCFFPFLFLNSVTNQYTVPTITLQKSDLQLHVTNSSSITAFQNRSRYNYKLMLLLFHPPFRTLMYHYLQYRLRLERMLAEQRTEKAKSSHLIPYLSLYNTDSAGIRNEPKIYTFQSLLSLLSLGSDMRAYHSTGKT